MTEHHIYDPLRNHGPGCGRDHVPSYWAATAGPAPADDGPLGQDGEAEVAIIGGGYTGLSCALHLARDHGIDAVVLEANRAGWGCSGRNGGYVRPAIGKLSAQAMIDRWGLAAARGVYAETQATLATLRGLLAEAPVDCEVIEGGVLKVAHRPDRLAGLAEEARVLRDAFGYEAALLGAQDLRARFMAGPEAHGALHYPEGLGLHPLKLAHGLLVLARGAGARVRVASEVLGWSRDGSAHRLSTAGGALRARRVVVASNGYTAEGLHPAVKGRLLPVLSHIVVTRPLSADEKAACGYATAMPVTDTRHINQYYRLLPDDRLLFGSRGATTDSAASRASARRFLADRLGRKFPPLAGIAIDYDWNGWVCLTYDWIPHMGAAAEDPTVFYSLGYGGSGVAFAIQAGKRLAERIAGVGNGQPALPSFTAPLPSFPFAACRRLGQRIGIAWLQMKDRR